LVAIVANLSQTCDRGRWPASCRLPAVGLRINLSRAIRNLRKLQKITQTQLAKTLETSQPRIASIESGAPGVSLEQMISGYIALGGIVRVTLHDEPIAVTSKVVATRPQSVKAKKAAAAC
jgi:predicted transcriptional regulator